MANYSTETASSTDAQRARQIAGHFRDLQGLCQVPFGILLLFLFAGEVRLPLSREELRTWPTGQLVSILVVLVGGFALAFVATKLISDWYVRRFGTVERTRHQRRLGALIAAGGGLFFVEPMIVEQRTWVDSGQTMPLNVVLFTMAIWIFVYWWYLGRSVPHYLVLAGIGLALGLASMAGLPPNTWPWHLREATLYLAAAATIGGLLDHRILSRSLSRKEDRVGKES